MSTPINAETTIRTLVEAMLPRGSGRGKALYVVLVFKSAIYTDEDAYEQFSQVHLLFERPSNYTKVFSLISNSFPRPSVDMFRMTSDHDSCWATDGLVDVFDGHMLNVDALREKDPNGRISTFNCIYSVRHVEIEYDRDPENPHRKILTSIR